MKNKMKILATAAIAVSTAFVGFSANAQLSLNGVVEKIELVEDATNYFGTRVTIYEPNNRIGANSTKTVDFFDQTNGSRYSLQKPAVGEYETAIVHFSTLELSSTTVGIPVEDILDDLEASGQLFAHEGNSVLVLGDADLGGGAGSVDTEVMGAAGAGNVPMQPVIVTSGGFSLPTLNLGLPSSSAAENATAISFLGLPAFQTISKNVDSSNVGDVALEVQSSVFDGVTGFTSGTSKITVGLFDTTIPEKPAYVTTFKSSRQASDTTIEDVTFYDVPNGFDFVPLAWFDGDNDKRLDEDEYVTAHNFTVSTAAFTMDADGWDYTADGPHGELDEAVVQMGPRTFTLEFGMTAVDTASSLLNNAAAASSTVSVNTITLDGTAAAGETPGTLEASMTIVYDVANLVSNTVTVPVSFAADAAGNNALIENGEVAHVVLKSSSLDVAGASFASATDVLSIANVPAKITTIGGASEYGIEVNLTNFSAASSAGTGYGAVTAIAATQATEAIASGAASPAIAITTVDDN
ncbi:hypothetical protein [Phycobacter azelaicus]|uniref:hypothetical protein n=1 Tax=Phycobacter azelaicus TaxID=2668075 RepID=UPI00186725D7|nr:hypothetical protein [Phycobacter azelaicus]